MIITHLLAHGLDDHCPNGDTHVGNGLSRSLSVGPRAKSFLGGNQVSRSWDSGFRLVSIASRGDPNERIPSAGANRSQSPRGKDTRCTVAILKVVHTHWTFNSCQFDAQNEGRRHTYILWATEYKWRTNPQTRLSPQRMHLRPDDFTLIFSDLIRLEWPKCGSMGK